MLGCSCKSQSLVISNDISHVGKRMQGLIRAPLLFSTAAKVLPHTSKATVKVMSGADALCITRRCERRPAGARAAWTVLAAAPTVKRRSLGS